jgi:hypothetical protein
MFFKILDRALGLRVVARTGREFAIAHLAQFPAQSLHSDGEAELLKHPLRQIDQPPAHDAMDRRRRPFFNHFHQRRVVRVIEFWRLAGGLPINQSVGAMGVELHHPVAHDLQRHIADLLRLGAHGAVINCGEREKPSRLRRVLARIMQRFDGYDEADGAIA